MKPFVDMTRAFGAIGGGGATPADATSRRLSRRTSCYVLATAFSVVALVTTEVSTLGSPRFLAILSDLRPVVSMVLSFMKVVLAVFVLSVLWGYDALDDDEVARTIAGRPAKKLVGPAGWRRLRAAFNPRRATFSAGIVGVYVILLVWMGFRYHRQLGPLSVALTIVVGVMGIFQVLWSLWRVLITNDRHS